MWRLPFSSFAAIISQHPEHIPFPKIDQSRVWLLTIIRVFIGSQK